MQYKSTIGADFLTKEITIDGSVVQLQVKIKKYNNKIKKNKKKIIYSYGIQQDKKNFMQWEHHFIVIQNVVY
jgi:hypothetical protein